MQKRVQWILAGCVWLVLAALVWLQAQFSADGGLSVDASFYLKAAQSLIDGEGPYIYFHGENLNSHAPSGPDGRIFFATWPLGYPALIALISLVSTLDVYVASKLLAVLLSGGLILWLVRLYGLTGALLATSLLSVPWLNIVHYSWSEIPFTLVMLVLALAGERWWTTRRLPWLIAMLTCCLMLFLLRYIGAFSLGVMALVGFAVLYRERNWSHFVWMAALSTLVLGLMAAYLYMNQQLIGYPTGQPRAAAQESLSVYLEMIRKAHSSWLRALLWAVGIGGLITAALLRLSPMIYQALQQRMLSACHVTKLRPFGWVCLSMGLLYWTALIMLRALSHFDPLGDRLLTPAFIPLIFGLSALGLASPRARVMTASILFGLVMVSLYQTAKPLLKHVGHHAPFTERLAIQHHLYASLPQGTLLFTANMHAQFLRKQVYPFHHLWLPEDLNYERGIHELCANPHVHYLYADYSEYGIPPERDHPFLAPDKPAYGEAPLVKITECQKI